MSARQFSNSGIANKNLLSTVPNVSSNPDVWVRHPAWVSITVPSDTDQKFVGLHIVSTESNFVALSAAGNYTVDWGDGTVEDYASGVVAYHEYLYSNSALNDTNGPVTFQDSSNTVTRANHGFTDGMRVTFYNITTTTGITEGQIYYVRDASTNTFSVSSISGGSAIDLVGDGSATLLPYKQAVVQVYPQAGQNLTSLKLNQKHNKTNLQTYASGFVDIAIAGANLTTLTVAVDVPGRTTRSISFAGLEQVNLVKTNLRDLERLFYDCSSLRSVVNISTTATSPTTKGVSFTDAGDLVTCVNHGLDNLDIVYFTQISSTTGISTYTRYWAANVTTDTFTLLNSSGSAVALTTDGTGTLLIGTSLAGMFTNCRSLQTVPLFDTASVTDMSNMFSSCFNLQSLPLFNTAAVTNMSGMCSSCNNLQAVPLFNTALVTNMGNMFSGCYGLQSVPLFDTSSVSSMLYMFENCKSIQTVPLFNTVAVTNMNSMFISCSGLLSVPLFNTAAVTNMGAMFSSCTSLQSVPLFNTASVTNMSSMFSGCYILQTVPLFNTAAVINMSSMFSSCRSFKSVPLFNTVSVTDMSGMFSDCRPLRSVPLFNTASVTNMSNTFSSCISLQSVPLFNTSAVTNMSSMFNSCTSLPTVPLFNTAAVTNMNSMFSSCSNLQSVPPFNTAAVTNMGAMFSGCSALRNIPALSAAGGTSSTSYNGMFSGCPSLSTISITGFKYTFSVTTCGLSSAALDALYTNLATVTGQTITVTGNHGTTADTPSIATAKGWTVTG